MCNLKPIIRKPFPRVLAMVALLGSIVLGCATMKTQTQSPAPTDADRDALLAEAAARFQFPDAPPFLTVLDKAQVDYQKDGGFRVEVQTIWACRAKPTGAFPLPLAFNLDLQILKSATLHTWRLSPEGRYTNENTQDLKAEPAQKDQPAALAGLVRIVPPSLEAGEAMEINYVVENKPVKAAETDAPAAEKSFAFRWQDPQSALRRELVLSRPPDLDLVGVRQRVPSAAKMFELRSKDRVVDRWVLEGLQPGLPQEPYGPPLGDLAGVTAFTPFHNWQSALDPFKKDCDAALEDNSDLDAAFDGMIPAATEGADSKVAKARRLLQALRAKWRYDDPGLPLALQTRRDLKEANDSGWVTPREAGLILAAALKHLGLAPQLYLARRNPGGGLLTQSPALTQFDELLLNFTFGGATLWVDPAEPLAPVGDLPLALLGVEALAVSQPLKWTDTPDLLAKDHRKERNVRLEISSQGDLQCSVELTAHGSSEVALRQFFRATTDSQRRDIVSRGLAKRFPKAQLTDYRFGDYRDLDHPFLVTYVFEVPGYAEPMGPGRLRFYPPVFEDVEEFMSALQPTRRTPVVLSQNFNSTVRQIIRLPKGWKVPDLPPDASLSNPVAEFLSNPKMEFGTLLDERYTGLKKRRIEPGEEYQQLQDFYQAVLKQDRTPFIASGPVGAPPAAKPRQKRKK